MLARYEPPWYGTCPGLEIGVDIAARSRIRAGPSGPARFDDPIPLARTTSIASWRKSGLEEREELEEPEKTIT